MIVHFIYASIILMLVFFSVFISTTDTHQKIPVERLLGNDDMANVSLDETTLIKNTSLPLIVKSYADTSAVEAPFNVKKTTPEDANKLASGKGFLNIDKINKVVRNSQEFTKMLSRYTANESVKSLSNKSKYEEFFYNQKDIVENSLIINQIECDDSVCIASLRLFEESALNSFLDNLQTSENTYIKSLVVSRDAHNINLIFATNANSDRILVSQ